MKKLKKLLVMLACVTVLLTVTVSGTVAFLADNSSPVVNEFTPTNVTPGIEEEFDHKVKKNVVIRNNGNIAAYVRAAVVITLQNEAGTMILPAEANKHYNITWGATWDRETTDDLYYWPAPVGAGDATGALIVECTPVSANIPDGYKLHVEVLAQAIQAQPNSVVVEEWKVNLATDGATISK